MQRDQPASHLRTNHYPRMENSTMLIRIPGFRPTRAARARAPVCWHFSGYTVTAD